MDSAGAFFADEPVYDNLCLGVAFLQRALGSFRLLRPPNRIEREFEYPQSLIGLMLQRMCPNPLVGRVIPQALKNHPPFPPLFCALRVVVMHRERRFATQAPGSAAAASAAEVRCFFFRFGIASVGAHGERRCICIHNLYM